MLYTIPYVEYIYIYAIYNTMYNTHIHIHIYYIKYIHICTI